MALNSVIFIGRMVNDPELKTTPNGVNVTSFSIAVDRPFQSNSGDDRITDFFNVVAWRSNAEFITKYFRKGSPICVQGYMTSRKYTDKDGNNRTAFEMVVEHVHFVGKKEDSGNDSAPVTAPPANNNAVQAPYSQNAFSDFAEIDDSGDLPFN